jgi:hypothetical protein
MHCVGDEQHVELAEQQYPFWQFPDEHAPSAMHTSPFSDPEMQVEVPNIPPTAPTGPSKGN